MDECWCDYHHGLWMTCPQCTQRLEDDYFKAIVLAAKMGGNVSRFGYRPLSLQLIKMFCDLPAEEIGAHYQGVRQVVVEERANR